MSRALIIGPAEEALVAALIAEAAANVVDYATMQRLHKASGSAPSTTARLKPTAGGEAIREMNSARTITIPMGYSCTYTQEEHGKPGAPVVCRHLSIALENSTKGPNPIAVQEIMKLFGFHNPFSKTVAWVEEMSDGGYAVNFVEPLDGDMRRLMKS